MAAVRVAFGTAANASLVGAKTVMSFAVLSVSTRPAALTAPTSWDRTGLLLAAVATGAVAMPENEPAPLAGTAEQAAPNGVAAIESAVELEEEELLIGELLDDEDDPALSEELPQAARPSGRARERAAMVLRRASRMMSLLVGKFLHPAFGAVPSADCPDTQQFCRHSMFT